MPGDENTGEVLLTTRSLAEGVHKGLTGLIGLAVAGSFYFYVEQQREQVRTAAQFSAVEAKLARLEEKMNDKLDGMALVIGDIRAVLKEEQARRERERDR